MLHTSVETFTVRVVPRSGRTRVEVDPGWGLTIRVRAAPADGEANREAARALAAHLGVALSAVSLRRGARSRTKVFEVRR
jgi:uncharacterized protein